MISVIIPAYNAARFIRRTIDSVLGQTFKDIELIVVDDGSSDSTGEIVKSYGDKVRYICQKNAGDGPARNTGILAAKGQWIAFLDHDDQWLPEKLQNQMLLLQKHPHLNWCATSYIQSYGENKAVMGNSPAMKNLCDKGFCKFFEGARIAGAHVFMTSTMIIRKNVFDQAGLFEACWLRIADQDMWWRIAYRNPEIGFITEPQSIMHLDVQAGLNLELSHKDAGRKDARKLVLKHMPLAAASGNNPLFRPFATSFIRKILRTTLFYGFKADARETLLQFPYMFTWYERAAAYIMSAMPAFTSSVLKGLSAFKKRLHLNKEVTRPYKHTRN